MRVIKGDYFYTTAEDATDIVEVSGGFDARSATTVSVPNLEKCGGFDASSATTVSVPKLKECNGGFYASSATTVSVPNLEKCGWFDASSATIINLKNLKFSGEIDAFVCVKGNFGETTSKIFINREEK